MEGGGWSPHPAVTGRAPVAVALWEDRDIVMYPTDSVSCFSSGETMEQPRLGFSRKGGRGCQPSTG